MILAGETRKRYDAFWSADAYERCALYLTLNTGGAIPQPADPVEKWTDIDGRLRRELQGVGRVRYLADAFHSVFTNFGPGCLTACVGGSARWAKDTVWFENEPFFIEDWENPPVPAWNPDSSMARLLDEFISKYLAAADGRYLVSLTDIGGTYDILAAMRGTQNLLFDLIEHPEEVISYVDSRIAPLWKACFEEETRRLMAAQGAVTSWMPIYSEKPYYPLQCDFSAMISPAMFGEFILPDLRRQTEFMDRSIYHLDGPGEIPHLDLLLGLPRLSAIQWTSGDGKPELTDPVWFDLYDRIQRAGKGIVLLGVNPNGVERLLNHISAKGLYMSIGVNDPKAADETLRIVNAKGAA
ncbi:MAG: hypothetical protein LBS11_04160 [Oscillospiraceae bacterium]|jgi:5-methyltetrahydrofolate--homocysteine methyltransferase|nr:hypothetical protein [Oscillospiraceae bacterium]